MTVSPENGPPLSLDDVTKAVLELSDERELGGLVTRFQETLRRWAAPSAVLAAVRDPATESGWRLLPALSAGSGPLGVERSLRQLVADVPEGLARPSLVRPAGDVRGVRVRENCVVPWSYEGDSGVLLLRGIPDSRPANLANAVALLSTPVWPRLLGGPASRVEASVTELRRLAERLREDAGRQLERLEAARSSPEPSPESAPQPASEPATEPSQVADLERQLQSARAELAGAADRADQQRRTAEEARGTARAAEEARMAALRELEEARAVASRSSLELEGFKARAAALQRTLEGAEEQRDRARVELEALTNRVASLQAELTSAVASGEEQRRAADDARAAARTADDAVASLRKEHAAASARVDQGARPPGEARSEPTPGPDRSAGVLRTALLALQRAAFVPAGLRVSMQEATAAVADGQAKAAPRLVVALLDRDAVGLEPLAEELEAAGLGVKIANHPEELTLLMKTPDAKGLHAAVCDVLAFRPDQNVAGLFRAWEKDRSGLALYLTFSPDSPSEVERAQRVPLSLTAGRFQRPLKTPELLDTLENAAWRQVPKADDKTA